MKESFAVTVIVPVRNAASHLPAALASIVPQLQQSDEILVIDGGSTDDSVAIASAHGARLLHQQGQGLAAARNQAILASHTPWIAFCDGDDRWATGALAVRRRAVEENPTARAVIGRVVRERLPGTEATPAQLEQVGRPVPGFTPGAVLVRRETFEAIGLFDESLAIGADSDWFVRLQESDQPVLQIDDTVLFKGARGVSLSADVEAYRRELLVVARRFIGRRRGNSPP
jgi:glycosyltransferase involved in cell wall biosynthesis